MANRTVLHLRTRIVIFPLQLVNQEDRNRHRQSSLRRERRHQSATGVDVSVSVDVGVVVHEVEALRVDLQPFSQSACWDTIKMCLRAAQGSGSMAHECDSMI